jgi:hypothetical protein
MAAYRENEMAVDTVPEAWAQRAAFQIGVDLAEVAFRCLNDKPWAERDNRWLAAVRPTSVSRCTQKQAVLDADQVE